MRPRGKEGQQTSCRADGQHVVDSWRETTQHVEASEDDYGDKKGIVVEDRKCGGLKIGDFILLPQDPLILLLLAHLLVLGELLGELPCDGFLALDRDLVLQQELGVAVGHRDQVCGKHGDDEEGDQRGVQVDHVYPPEEPDGDRGNDESVTVKQGRGFRGHVPAEVLQEELLFLGKPFRGLC